MPVQQLVMPQLGESVVEGTISKWLVREGDSVEREQALVEVGTDKADSELPAPSRGRVSRILAKEGQVVRVGQPLCEIEVSQDDARGVPRPEARTASHVEAAEAAKSAEPSGAANQAAVREPGLARRDVPPSATEPPSASAGASAGASDTTTMHTADGIARRPAASPLVRKLALQRGVDVSSVEGTGVRGRVTRDDVLHADARTGAAEHAQQGPVDQSAPAEEGLTKGQGVDPELVSLLNSGMLIPVPGVGFGAYRVPAYRPHEGDQVVPFNRRRRLLAHHMAYSKITAPHVVTVAEVDLHRTSQLREAHKDRYRKEGVPLTILAFVCHATVRALREHPTMNARVLEDAYVLLRDINLGIAVDAPEGLIVPNIKHADELSLRGLAKAIDDIAQKARASKITADDLANSSFSVSNPGLKGNLFGGAIIAQPNVGILRMGKIQKRAVVVEANGEDVIAIHPVMYLALSYDHRVIDGVLGNSFLYRVTEILEKADFEV